MHRQGFPANRFQEPPVRQPRFAIAIAAISTLALSASASAEAVTYTFTLTGAGGSFAGGAFSDETVSWTLFADTEDVQPGSPRGFNVTPLSGEVLVGDVASEMTAALIANSAVWTYTNEEQGLRIGFGIFDPFESFTSGSYDGPLGWDMTTSFAAVAVGEENILRAIQDDGIETLAGTLLVTDYATASFEAVVVPAPPVAVALLAFAAGGRRRR